MSGFKRNSRTSGILFLIVIFQVPGPSMARPFPKARSQNGNRTTADVGTVTAGTVGLNLVGGILAGTGTDFTVAGTTTTGELNSTGGASLSENIDILARPVTATNTDVSLGGLRVTPGNQEQFSLNVLGFADVSLQA